jgi:hypothetical protein
MKKVKVNNKEKQLDNKLKRLLDDIKHINPPTRFFSIDEEVVVGNIDKCIILESYNNGLYYKVFCHKTDHNYGNPIKYTETNYWYWHDIFPLSIKQSTSNFTPIDEIRLNYYNSSMDSLLSKVYFQGVDFNPEYQRDYVWSLEDKQYLIHSIFNKIDIGKFTFYIRSYEEEQKIGDNNRCEIIDGKQRLSTFIEFYENRFQYEGKYYTDLGFKDRNQFDNFNIVYAETTNLTKEQRIKLFLKVNITGKVMDKEHLKNVEKLLTK